ncbi:MAG: penicillin-binding protein 2 [Bacilli bacterium]|nr:penicillin-binding protein 2 [Bacilli bacterium]MBR6137737.1 penicillin-binding protein 2 [Bacilli bacterium]
MRKKTNKSYELIIRNRFYILLSIIVILFGIVMIKITNVMLFQEDMYKDSLEHLTYTKVTGTSSPRGRIYDRNYNIIVDNKSLKTITYQKPKKATAKDMIEVASRLSPHIYLDYTRVTLRSKKEYFCAKNPETCNSYIKEKEREKVKQRKLTNKDIEELKLERIPEEELHYSDEELKLAYLYYLMNKGYTFEEKIIKSDVSDEEYAYVSEHVESLVGFNTKIDWERSYPYGDTFKTILGKVSTTTQGIPAEEKDYYLEKGYSLNDRVGISYIEKEYEEYLKGEKPVYEIVSAHESKLVQEGTRGQDIVLTIDINLQKAVEEIITRYVLATKYEPNTEYYDHSTVVIADPTTGEILAMASKRLVNGEIVDYTTSILTSPIMPGSIVKGGSMLVGYNTGAVHIGETMLDECVKVAGVAEKCSSVNDLGVINDITALAKSSNVYQFKIAIRVNGQEYYRGMKMNFNQSAFDTYRNMYHSFGLGVKTGIDLPVESKGYTSTDRAAGNLLDFVMGQYETYTPIQLSQYIGTIANGGARLQPHLLKEIHSSSETEEIGTLESKFETNVLNYISTTPEYMNRVREGFYAVMHSPGGYGVGYMDDWMEAAGKTGTSQSFIDTNNDGVIDTETITSTFIGYAPAYAPKVSFVVTSPDSSHPNSNIDYRSLVTYYLTRDIARKYTELYGLP